MLTYNDLYEFLRKEKYSEQLQNLPKDFVIEFGKYMTETRKKFSDVGLGMEGFTEDLLRDKKQYENAMAIYKELMLRRKRKILNLVFVAAETGIMKRDFADMLPFEQDLFERLVMAVDDADKSMSETMNGKPLESKNRMILVKDDIEQFVDMSGGVVGPFKKGNLVNLEAQVGGILVEGGKAMFVEEDK
jgi:DNA replication initiation complex subunit (GINS family)